MIDGLELCETELFQLRNPDGTKSRNLHFVVLLRNFENSTFKLDLSEFDSSRQVLIRIFKLGRRKKRKNMRSSVRSQQVVLSCMNELCKETGFVINALCSFYIRFSHIQNRDSNSELKK